MLSAELALVLMSASGLALIVVLAVSLGHGLDMDYEQHTDVLNLLFSKRLVSHHGIVLTLSHGTVTANIGVCLLRAKFVPRRRITLDEDVILGIPAMPHMYSNSIVLDLHKLFNVSLCSSIDCFCRGLLRHWSIFRNLGRTR